MNFLKKLEPTINKVGKKHNITISEGKYILEMYFKSLAKAFNDPRMPKIMTPICTFTPTIGRISIWVSVIERWRKSNNISDKLYEARAKRIFPIYQRLVKEGNRERTWVEWNSKDKKVELQKLVDNVDSIKREEEAKKKKRLHRANNNVGE